MADWPDRRGLGVPGADKGSPSAGSEQRAPRCSRLQGNARNRTQRGRPSRIGGTSRFMDPTSCNRVRPGGCHLQEAHLMLRELRGCGDLLDTDGRADRDRGRATPADADGKRYMQE